MLVDGLREGVGGGKKNPERGNELSGQLKKGEQRPLCPLDIEIWKMGKVDEK